MRPRDTEVLNPRTKDLDDNYAGADFQRDGLRAQHGAGAGADARGRADDADEGGAGDGAQPGDWLLCADGRSTPQQLRGCRFGMGGTSH